MAKAYERKVSEEVLKNMAFLITLPDGIELHVTVEVLVAIFLSALQGRGLSVSGGAEPPFISLGEYVNFHNDLYERLNEQCPDIHKDKFRKEVEDHLARVLSGWLKLTV